MRVGDKVRVQRDEKLYPSRGTWPQFSGKTGILCAVNPARIAAVCNNGVTERVRITAEYGVSFTKSNNVDAWFRSREITVIQKGEG